MGGRQLNLLHLVTRSHRRGAELVALELAAELDALGHTNRVVALSTGEQGGRIAALPPLVDSSGIGPKDLPVRVARLRKLLSGSDFDVVVAHGGFAAQVAAVATLGRGPALVWQRIDVIAETVWSHRRRWWWRWVARRFDAAVALTGQLDDELRRLGFTGPIWRIPNFRDPSRFRDLDRDRATARLRSEVGVGPDVHLVGFVAYLDGRKRADRALDVHAALIAGGVPSQLVVVGDGPMRPTLEADVRRRRLSESVTLLGARMDVEWILAGVDLLVITSDREGIPGVAIEALMAGCPVVTVPVGGVAEVVEDGVTGLVLADADPRRMAEAVASLLGDEPRIQAMRDAARRRIERFSASTTAKIYESRLRALLGERDLRPGRAHADGQGRVPPGPDGPGPLRG